MSHKILIQFIAKVSVLGYFPLVSPTLYVLCVIPCLYYIVKMMMMMMMMIGIYLDTQLILYS